MVTAAIIICTLFIAFIEKKELFTRPVKAEKVIIILLLIGTAIFSWSKENNSDNQQEHIQVTTDTTSIDVKALVKEKDSLKGKLAEAQQAIVDTVKTCSKGGIAQTQLTEKNITDAVAKGVERGIREGRKNKSDLSGEIAAHGKTEAYITHSPDPQNTTTHKQSNDTVFIFTRMSNTGDKNAEHMNYSIFFISSFNGYLYEYFRPIGEVENNVLPGNMTSTETRGFNYIPSFHFDSTNEGQHILILGKFNNNQDINFGYNWNPKNNGWERDMNWGYMKDFHNSKRKKRFTTQNNKIILEE